MKRHAAALLLALAIGTGSLAAAPPGPAPAPAPAPDAPAAPPPPVSIPATLKVRPGRLKVIRAVTQPGVSVVTWVNLNEDDLDVVPQTGGNSVIVSAQTPGAYRVMAIVVDQTGKLTYTFCAVTVAGTPKPAPPGPGPGPTPPGPTPPTPSDPLTQALQAAYGAEAATDKATSVKALAALYKEAVGIANDPKVTTWGKLFGAINTVATSSSYGLAGKIPAMQGVVQAELKKTLPVGSGLRLDAAGRTSAAKAFTTVATALGSVK